MNNLCSLCLCGSKRINHKDTKEAQREKGKLLASSISYSLFGSMSSRHPVVDVQDLLLAAKVGNRPPGGCVGDSRQRITKRLSVPVRTNNVYGARCRTVVGNLPSSPNLTTCQRTESNNCPALLFCRFWYRIKESRNE